MVDQPIFQEIEDVSWWHPIPTFSVFQHIFFINDRKPFTMLPYAGCFAGGIEY